ncbi:MAG: ATP-binding protein, partial [Acidimicrobiia bacterium]|nr:ATP-binding protein [Acidimicrobiia bacterium]
EARAVQLALAGVDEERLVQETQRIADVLGVRVTVIERDGDVIADSAFAPDAMENHASRPEVVGAVQNGVGSDSRTSETTGVAQTYVAISAPEGRIYRLSVTEDQLGARVTEIGARIGIAALIAGVIGVAVMAIVARRVARPIQELTAVAREVSEGRLDMRPQRSSIRELDRLGLSIGRMADELGARVVEAESERETLGVLLNALPLGVVLVDADGSVIYGNGPAREILGEVPDRLAKLTPHRLQRLVREAVETDGTRDMVLESSGTGPTLRAIATPLPDGRTVLVVSDISERVRIERMRRDFVADASHELKTPIASILAASETLQMALERDPERAPRFVTLVNDAAGQLARIVGDLLDLSRLETSVGGGDLVRLDRIAEEETERMRSAADDKGITLVTELEEASVTGSASDLGLAVRNLISNAIRYSTKGDSVTVSTVVEGDNVRLSVEDTGAGIPRRSIDRVFERFYRVDVARSRETGGTGLGLAIVKHVAEGHGGSVSVESELGVGSVFHLVLPRVSAGEEPRPHGPSESSLP